MTAVPDARAPLGVTAPRADLLSLRIGVLGAGSYAGNPLFSTPSLQAFARVPICLSL